MATIDQFVRIACLQCIVVLFVAVVVVQNVSLECILEVSNSHHNSLAITREQKLNITAEI